MKVNVNIQPGDLKVRLNRFFELVCTENSQYRFHMGSGPGNAGIYRRWEIHHARMDRVDAGIPIWMRDFGI